MPEKFNFEIIKNIGVISENASKKIALTITKWGNNTAKYDIRHWEDDYKMPKKGVSVSEAELISIRNLLEKSLKCVRNDKPIISRKNGKFSFDIYEDFGDYATIGNYTGKVCFIGWGKISPKIDIRGWDSDFNNCTKGISLSDNEALNLINLIDKEFSSSNVSENSTVDTSDIDDDLFI